jgi:CMP-N-acetylneuraminic acid synthetase
MIAVIPARGGSKRIPRKNLAPFFGQPMLAYAIAAARHSALFDRVIVSTEDAEIEAVARACGAEVINRPQALATDDAGLPDVAAHALDQLGVKDGDAFCQLMPSCPLRRAEDIRAHWEAFERGRRAFQISVVPYRMVRPQWAIAVAPDGAGRWASEGDQARSQAHLPELVCPTGAIWWARAADFRAQRAFYGVPFHVERMDADRGMDIDTPEELALADLIVRGLRSRDSRDPLEACA